MPRVVPQVLLSFPESKFDLLAPEVGLPGAPMPIGACSLHVTYFGILHIVGLGLGALCWLALVLVSLSQLV